MNQVKEMSRFTKVIEGIKMAFAALSVNEEIVNNTNMEKQLEEIKKYEDADKISKLEKETTSVNISLKDEIVPKAKVSEEKAQRVANKVKEEKVTEKENKIRE